MSSISELNSVKITLPTRTKHCQVGCENRTIISPSRPSHHHGDLRNALLGALAEMIREGGVEAAGLRGAARRAGVSPAAPAHHFGNKTGMLTAYASRGYQLWIAEMEATLERFASLGAIDRFLELGVAYVRFAVQFREYFEVMYRHDLIDTTDPDLQAIRDHAGGTLMEATLAARQAGWAIAHDPLYAALSAWSSVHGLAQLWLSGTLDSRLTDVPVQNVTRRTLQVLLLVGQPP